MNTLLMVLNEAPGVIAAIFLGLGRDFVKNWWRYMYCLLAVLCIIDTLMPVGLPVILEVPFGLAIIIASFFAVIMPAWEQQALEDYIDFQEAPRGEQ